MGITTLGKVIRERRTQLGTTQQQIADLAGISVNTLYQLERGQSNPTVEVLVKIAEVLGMELKLEVRRKG
jgi:transcriptional regulator with XRE-family HTH domain